MTLADVGVVVASLFSGFGGGLLIRTIDQRQKNREAKENLDRELKGLMTLIFAEYGHNAFLLKMLIEEPGNVQFGYATNFEMAAWNSVKVRLAQFLTIAHISA